MKTLHRRSFFVGGGVGRLRKVREIKELGGCCALVGAAKEVRDNF